MEERVMAITPDKAIKLKDLVTLADKLQQCIDELNTILAAQTQVMNGLLNVANSVINNIERFD